MLAAAGRARLALALESAADAIRRRHRTLDAGPIEDAAEAMLRRLWDAQAGMVAPEAAAFRQDPRYEARVVASFDAAAAATAPVMTEAVRRWYMVAMTRGARRVVAQVGISEAMTAPRRLWVDPPGVGPDGLADVPLDAAGHAVLSGTVFSVRNREAERWLEQNAARLVSRVDAETRDRIRRIVAEGRVAGLSSERIARQIRSEYRYMGVGSPLGHIQSRAHLIAVTETAFGYEKGKRLAVDRMADAGLRMEKSWLTVGDGHVDPTCSDNEGAGAIPYDESFPSLVEEPPAHPGCRCTVTYRTLTRAERTDLPEPVAAAKAPTDPFTLNGPDPFKGRLAPETVTRNLSDFPKAVQREVDATFGELARDYPASARSVRNVAYDAHMGDEYAYVTSSAPDRIYMNLGPRFKDPRLLTESMVEDAGPSRLHAKAFDLDPSLPWHSVGGRPGEAIKGVIDHEWGHVMHRANRPLIDGFLHDTLPARLEARGVTATRNSLYGHQNEAEWWGELFAEARSRRPFADLSPAGQETRRWLRETAGEWR